MLIDVSTLANWVGTVDTALSPLLARIEAHGRGANRLILTIRQRRSWPRGRPARADFGRWCATTASLMDQGLWPEAIRLSPELIIITCVLSPLSKEGRC